VPILCIVYLRLHSLWYHHTYRCDDTRGCAMQFWPPDDEHMCSKHVEAWDKLIVKQKFCASSWLITEINILRCTASKTSKKKKNVYSLLPVQLCVVGINKWIEVDLHYLMLHVNDLYYSMHCLHHAINITSKVTQL